VTNLKKVGRNMEVIKTSVKDFAANKKMQYLLLKGDAETVSDLKDEFLDVPHEMKGYCLYNDVSAKTGEVIEVLAILTESKVIRATSTYFKTAFLDIVDIMGEELFKFWVVRKTSAKGRTFYTAALYLD